MAEDQRCWPNVSITCWLKLAHGVSRPTKRIGWIAEFLVCPEPSASSGSGCFMTSAGRCAIPEGTMVARLKVLDLWCSICWLFCKGSKRVKMQYLAYGNTLHLFITAIVIILHKSGH